MLTNPIRGKAGRQIIIPASTQPGQVLYTVPSGKYFEAPFVPANVNITFAGVSFTGPTTNIAAPAVYQAGTVLSSGGSSMASFFGTEYDA